FLKSTEIVQQVMTVPVTKLEKEEVGPEKAGSEKEMKDSVVQSAKSEKPDSVAPAPTPPMKKELPREVELTMATGPVEAGDPNEKKGLNDVQAGNKVDVGATLRTSPKACCEFRCPDGAVVRLDSNTEVVLLGERDVQLNRGQVWSQVPPSKEPRE